MQSPERYESIDDAALDGVSGGSQLEDLAACQRDIEMSASWGAGIGGVFGAGITLPEGGVGVFLGATLGAVAGASLAMKYSPSCQPWGANGTNAEIGRILGYGDPPSFDER